MDKNEVETVLIKDSKTNIIFNSLGVSNLIVFEDNYLYWRQYIKQVNEFFLPIASCIFLDAVGSLSEMNNKSMPIKKDMFNLFQD